MALKQIIGVAVTVFIAVYCLYFIEPALQTAYNKETSVLNMTTPTESAIKPITDSFMSMLPILIVLVLGFTIWLYANYRAEDYA